MTSEKYMNFFIIFYPEIFKEIEPFQRFINKFPNESMKSFFAEDTKLKIIRKLYEKYEVFEKVGNYPLRFF